jgi:gamma-glutamyltranspeptidase/glutathione hydrolase
MPDRPLVPAPVARGSHGAVVAPHHLATAAGLGILRAGGSAVDAAIAANAVLAVVMPGACGLGGDAFWLIWEPTTRHLQGLNGSGRAARSMDAATVRARGIERLPLRGPLTITVPGAVRSWGDAHARYGQLPMTDILDPAIELAAGGFPASDGFVASVERTAPIVADLLGPRSGWHAMFRPEGRAWRAGELVRQPALAKTLRRLAEVGTSDLYEGALAVRVASGLEAAGCPIRAEDLATHTSTWTEPLRGTYRDIVSATHPPNSQGITALQILGILDRAAAPAADAFGPAGVRDPGWIHRGIEAAKLAMADRDAEVTDPDRRAVPIERLLDGAHLDDLAARIDADRAARPRPATNPPGGGTIWLGVVDGDGMAVSLIESNYGGFGSGVADPAVGIHYQNRGSYFSLDPEHPNVLAGGKRTLHTLMPAMLLRDGEPWVVTGSMGGDAQPQVHAQVVSALVDGGVDVATAVGAPRWFVEPERHFAPPMSVRAEPRFAAGVLEALERLGHRVTVTEPFDGLLGHAHAIELLDGGPVRGGTLVAATDPRSEGLPAAW